MKNFVGYLIGKGIKAIPRKKKVSPDIKSVKPTKDIKGSVKRVKSKEYSKRIDKVSASKDKIDTGKKMMREGQKELKKMVDTKRAFKFKYGTTRQKTFPIEPGKDPKKEFKNLVEEKSTKKFKTAKQMEKEERRRRDREGFMGGGMMGRRFGMKSGTPKPKTNVEKIKETFGPKKNLKKIPEGKKGEGLRKLKAARPDVTRKMGFLKRGGRA